MSPPNIYRMTQPTNWAQVPESFSYSSLTKMEQCPRQWQLAHSNYGELTRFPARPNPASAEGDIVHRVLDRLFRMLALGGLPEAGTEEFRRCIAQVDVRGSVDALMQEHGEILANHPRGSSCRLRAGNQQLVNKIIRLFRTQYQPAGGSRSTGTNPSSSRPAQIPTGQKLFQFLAEYGALSELPLTHPEIEFSGIIDLLRLDEDGVSIIDFKTGSSREEHLKQVKLYAILWWRCSDTLPFRCQVRYPSEVRELAVAEHDLIGVETELKKRIGEAKSSLSGPWAEARTGDHCSFCDVRQFCTPFWNERSVPLPRRRATDADRQTVDIEVTVVSDPSDNGFEAVTHDGTKVSVVFQQSDAGLHGPFKKGEGLRILKCIAGGQNGEIELKPWTEVFHCSSSGDTNTR